MKSLSRVRPSATPWTAAFQAPASMGFSRQEYWSWVPIAFQIILVIVPQHCSSAFFKLPVKLTNLMDLILASIPKRHWVLFMIFSQWLHNLKEPSFPVYLQKYAFLTKSLITLVLNFLGSSGLRLITFEKNTKQCEYLEPNSLLNSFIFSGTHNF